MDYLLSQLTLLHAAAISRSPMQLHIVLSAVSSIVSCLSGCWCLLCFPSLGSSKLKGSLMRKLLTAIIVGSLLALLCLALQSSPALAHTNTATSSAQSQTITVYLKHSPLEGYYFSLTRVSLTVDSQLAIVNETDQDVSLTNNGNLTGVVLADDAYYTGFYPGVYRFTDMQQNIESPLTIHVSE